MSLVRAAGSSTTDNASYSVAATYDTVAMADQTGRIAVTLTNTGTSTWGSGYALGSQVFAAGDTTGTGTPVTSGVNVAVIGTVAPGGTVTVESVTPTEDPGSYEICWDMVNVSGTYFSAEGGDEFCAGYTIEQYAPVINEQEPLPGTDVDNQYPQLSVSAVVPGGYPASPEFSYAFEIVSGPTLSTATVEQSSGWVASNGNSWSPTTPLTWGDTYYWVATVSDAATLPDLTSASVTWTTPVAFVVGDAQPGVASQLGDTYQADDGDPVMTSDLGETDYSGSGKTVDPQTGNVSMQATDASVATAGPALSIVRTYNSKDPRTSRALGAGWSSLLDMSLVPDSDGSGALILTLADGQQVRFAVNASGGYAPPEGFYAVVSALEGGGFAVTDQTGTTYQFGQASGSSWLITGITDEIGAETFTYNSGMLTTITNTTSGRALHLTWATPSGATYPHVATVSTDPVTAGQAGLALTWTYGYSGDLLTSVCSPVSTTQCTTYSYITDGSHAVTSVLNADPTSYYRLDDPAGSAAAVNQIPVNNQTTVNPPATEMNTTLGVAGPVSGVSATGFNGKSSWIPLDGAWCTTPGSVKSCGTGIGETGRLLQVPSEALSIWFKTSTAGGTILGEDPDLPGSGNCLECDGMTLGQALYITSSGMLASQSCSWSTFTNNWACSTAMTSAAKVDDGAWHQAVLIPGQALYLDGAEVASSTAGWSEGDDWFAQLGAGMVVSTCTQTCTSKAAWSYFNGSMADLSIYQNQLPSSGTVAAQYAAETTPAAELSSITSPDGRAEFTATYDTVNDRVATVTDADGGTWTYSDPADDDTSAAYDSAVMGSSPEDFWPLSDTAGPDAQDLVGGAATSADPRPVATYANVTLGAAGPIGSADGTAATFTGSGSQISIPGGYWAGTGNGAESAEIWFNPTNLTGQLLSTSAGSGGNPIDLWLSDGCLEATIGTAAFDESSGCDSSAGTLTDGYWYQAVLTLSPVTGGTQTATLYLDGNSIGTDTISAPAASATGYTAYVGNGSAGDFTGSIADVSFYTTQLSADDASNHYNPLVPAVIWAGFTPSGADVPVLNTQVITVGDPAGKNAAYVYSSGSLVRETDTLGGTTYYGYDSADRASTITDPDGDTSYETYDLHNNVTSSTTCVAVNDCQTSYTSYYEDLSNPLDPRNDQPTDSHDARSSSPTDPAYDTVTTYTADGQIASQATPPTMACPAGCTTSYTYTTGSQAAAGGGTEPAGLLASITAPDGGLTSYGYTSAGDLAKVTDPLGMVTTYTYDNLGRELSETQISNTYPDGLTTSYIYNSADELLTETDPPVTDRVTGAVRTKVTTYTYDADGNMLSSTVSDSTGGDPSRATTYTYNAYSELASSKDSLGNVTTYTYDVLGDELTQTDPAGMTTAYSYDTAGNLLTVTMDGYTGNPSAPVPAENMVEQSRAYDPAGHLASVTSVLGTTTDYTYYGNGHLASSYVACSGGANCVNGEEDLQTYSYDAAGNQVSATAPDGLVTDTTYDSDNRPVQQTIDPAGVDQVTTDSYDPDGNVISQSLTGGGETQTETMTYNVMNQELSHTVDNTGGQDLTTSYVRDQRGLVISETDPEGNTTTIENDEAGQPVVETDPPVSSQTGNGGAPVTANPVTTTGYDTFGGTVEVEDADGNITRYTYDQDGNKDSAADPSYTQPGASSPVNGTTTYTYNDMGEKTSQTDPDGNVTAYTYDQLGHEASETEPGGGTWTFTHDPAGDQLSVTDPTGAQTQATYDNLGQQITSTDLVRQNTSAAYTTTYGYDGAGNQISQTSPAGVTSTTAYNAVGEEISSTDGAGNTTTYQYDLDGNLTRATLATGTATTTSYDLAGWPVSGSDLSATGTVLRTESVSYDADGQVTSSTDFDGNTSTAAYDATGMPVSQTEPVSSTQSVTTSDQYDLDGNQTAYTDGNGNTTYTAYNSLGLPQTVVEPATAQNPTAADSTRTDIYDGDGDLVTQDLPGGVQVNDSYDAMGDVTSESGGGASAATATRTYTYDQAGQMITADTSAAGTQGSSGYQPATSESFSYDDRGLLLAAAGSAGSSSFTYNGAGQLTSDTSTAGTSAYTYNSRGLLATDSDAASGVTGTYSYNNLDQVTGISHGTGNDTQSFSYDDLNRLASGTVTTAGGGTVASISYGYNNDDDVTSMTTTGLTTPSGTGTVTNTYGYDESDRLTSWTAVPAGGTATTQSYGYDADGNMTDDNGVTLTYDARDELISGSDGDTYTYSADGDLASQVTSGGTNGYTSDAYGQQITDGLSAYTWDGLDRLLGSTEPSSSSYSDILTYDGVTDEVASDSSDTYSRTPGGQITGVDTGGTKVIALDDGHDDLSGTFTASGTSMTSSTTYSPWGAVLASSGPAIQVGYQGQWTDPVTEQVNMGSRMYSAGAGPRFINKDTDPGKSDAAVSSGFSYGDDNPMSQIDPSGHFAIPEPWGGGGTPNVTAADVRAAAAQVSADKKTVEKIKAELRQADADVTQDDQAASGDAAKAKQFNDAAKPIEAEADKDQAQAKEDYDQAQQELRQEPGLKDNITNAENTLTQALNLINNPNTNPQVRKLAEENLTELREGVSNAQQAYSMAVGEYNTDLANSGSLSEVAGQLAQKAAILNGKATGARTDAANALQAAASAKQDAVTLTAQLGKAEDALGKAEANSSTLNLEYQAEELSAKDKDTHKSGACHGFWGCLGEVLAKAGDVLNAVTEGIPPDGFGFSCGDEDGDEEDPGDEGGESFTAGTLVLLADGKMVPISRLKPGDKVLATSTKTGKTQAETVTAVLVHHDTDLYDLKIRDHGKTAVIDTTSNHLFFISGTSRNSGRWVKAGALKYGTHLRTPDGSNTATVVGGWIPRQRDAWMWDLTIPGNNDHDFYVLGTAGQAISGNYPHHVEADTTAVLVHNYDGCWEEEFSNLKDGNQAGSVKVVSSETELRALFDKWTAGAERLPARGSKIPDVFKLNDGTIIQWRTTSKSGGATIDISSGGKILKVHINDGS